MAKINLMSATKRAIERGFLVFARSSQNAATSRRGCGQYRDKSGSKERGHPRQHQVGFFRLVGADRLPDAVYDHRLDRVQRSTSHQILANRSSKLAAARVVECWRIMTLTRA
jgi:hypothetical protein